MPNRVSEIDGLCSSLSARFDGSPNFGPAHLVIEDGNYDDEFIRYCLKQLNAGRYDHAKHGAEEIAATRQLLVQLLQIPESDRCPIGDAP